MRVMSPTLLVITAFSLLAAAACSAGAGPSVEARPISDGAAPSGTQERPDRIELVKGPVSPEGMQAIFGTPDLGLGENRIGVVLTSEVGLVRAPSATILSYYFPDDGSTGELKQTTVAVFRPWPYGTRGLYTTRLSFDRPGRWGLEITVPTGSGAPAELFFDVEEKPSAPSVGSPAVLSVNKTVEDVERLSQLSTGSLRDPDLYQLTVAEAASSGRPTVVVMASPAFCTNAVCGPQVEVLQQLKDRYRGRANFIHVDFYDNPEEIQGDLDRARLSPVVEEWRLPSGEWSFVIDRNGIVSDRFEAFATLTELEEGLRKVL